MHFITKKRIGGLRHAVLLPRNASTGVSQILCGTHILEVLLRTLVVPPLPKLDLPVVNAVTRSCGSADILDLATAAFFCLVCFCNGIAMRRASDIA